MKRNLVYVVGLGPGDPQFLTAQAKTALENADVLCGYTEMCIRDSIGTKGTWYDHKVSVRDPQPIVEDTASDAETEVPEDGTYTCSVTLEGGSGRATIESPTELTVADGKMTAEITWSSPNYDYMIVDGEKYLPVNTEGNSVFEIPVAALDTALAVTADTTAMSTPHEIEYTLTFDSASLTA